MNAALLKQIKALPVSERIDLAKVLLADIATSGYGPELTPEEVAELNRRAEEAVRNPGRGQSWEEFREDLRKLLRSKG